MRKYSIDVHRVHHSIRLVVTLFVLLGFFAQNVSGTVYVALLMQSYTTVSSPSVILQDGTAGSSTIYTNSTSAKVSVVAPAPVPTYYPDGYSVVSGNWWNSNYLYRKKISITNNNATVSIPAKFTSNFTVDTQQMVTDGKLQADGNDFRIVWWNSSSSSWLELDRLNTTNFNTASTTMKFRTQASVAGGSSDDDYYIYYGYSGAANPPANGSNVYFFEDLFNRADSSTVGFGWIEYDGVGTSDARIFNNQLNLESANFDYDTQAYHMLDGVANRSVWEFNWNFTRTGAETTYSMWMQLGKYSLMSNTSNTAGASVYLDWTGTGAVHGGAASTHEMLRVWNGSSVTEIGVLSGSHDIKLDMDLSAGSFTIYIDGNNNGTYNVYQKLSSYDCIRFVFERATLSNFGSYDINSTRVYLTRDPNPSASIGQEESYYYVSGTVPGSVQTVDSDYLIIKSAGSATATLSYNPSDHTLGGSTTLVSGSVSNLTSDDGVNMTFRSYSSSNTTSQPIVNMNFTSDATGWVYGEANDVNNFASGAWSSSGGNGDLGCYDLMVDDILATEIFDVEQWVNYTFTIDVIPLQAIIYASYRYTSTDDATGTPKIKLVRPDSSIVDVWIGSTATLVAGSDTGHTYVSVDATSNFTSTGTYQLSLYTHTDSLKAADKPTVHNYWDDAGITFTDPIYTAEVEFTGSSNTYTWTELNLTVDSSWTVDSVNVTIQVYDSTAVQYPTSGEGYLAYTSGTANTDETKILTIKTSQRFRNATGNWKIKVKGVKTTDTQFDFKADWIEYKPTCYSEYTVSTEFLFSGTTQNTPTQLNFTVVTQCNTTGVNVTIQIWNYSSSTYVTSGEGYSTYISSGSNETTDLSINTNPQFYTSGGNAKINVTGVLTTNSTYQQETNQIKLVYKYDASSNYDYVLRVNNTVTDSWQIRLKKYGDSNINRLQNCTIYFHNSSDGTSRQIYIQNGLYTNQTGPWYDLSSLATIYIAMTATANSTATSYVRTYLEILTPSTTTYAQYIITFEIT